MTAKESPVEAEESHLSNDCIDLNAMSTHLCIQIIERCWEKDPGYAVTLIPMTYRGPQGSHDSFGASSVLASL